MGRRLRTAGALGGILAAALTLWGCGGSRSGGGPQRLTVSAAVSLKESLEEIGSLYRRERPQVSIAYNFGGSGTLQRQIEQGAPVDVFISASLREMDALEAKGLVLAGTRRNIATNEVVLIVPRDSKAVSGFGDLRASHVRRIAIGEPGSVPAGRYAKEALTFLGLWDEVRPKLVYTQDVRQVLEFVASGDADAGIVYRTDAELTERVQAVEVAPAGSHSPIAYPAAVLKESSNPDEAKRFVEFLAGPAAQAVLAKHGFAN